MDRVQSLARTATVHAIRPRMRSCGAWCSSTAGRGSARASFPRRPAS